MAAVAPKLQLDETERRLGKPLSYTACSAVSRNTRCLHGSTVQLAHGSCCGRPFGRCGLQEPGDRNREYCWFS